MGVEEQDTDLSQGSEESWSGDSSLREAVYTDLKKRIVGGELRPGFKLVERDLVKQYEVSRTPVREAIGMLVMEGWLNLLPRKGAVVAGLSSHDVEEIFQIRIPLEDMAVQLAFRNLDDAAIRGLHETLHQLRRAAAAQDLTRFVDLDISIHFAIVRLTGNSRLETIITNLANNIRRYGEASIVHPGRVYESLYEHERLCEALSSSDLYEARLSLQEHLWNTRRHVMEFIKRENSLLRQLQE